MKNVDVIFPAYINAPIGPTGTLRRLIENRDYLKKQGYNLRIFTLDYLSDKPLNDTSIKMPERDRNKTSRMKVTIKKSRFLTQLFLHFHVYKNAKKLVNKYIKEHNNADILVFHESLACYSYLNNSKRQNNIKAVLFHHSDGKRWSMMLKSWPKLEGTMFYKAQNRRMNFIDENVNMHVFIAENGLNGFVQEHPKYNINKLYFLHNGIEDIPLANMDRTIPPYRLITVGSVIERKGQRHIVEALAKLSEDRLKLFHLDILGAGNDLEHVKSLIHRNNLQDNVTLHGSISPEDVNNYLAKANVYMLMSNNEGLPISIIEAMRVGLPIISTPIAGIPEQVDDRNGLLIHPSADSIVNVFNKMEEYNWRELGKASRKRFEEEFTFDIMLEKYCDMLNSLNK